MNILVVNCGSSSLKFQLIDSETEQVSASGNCERIGLDGKITYKAHGDKFVTETDLPEHGIAIKKVLELLVDKERGVINSLDEIHAVGHRMVHGGEKFSSSVVITEDVIKDIESCNDLAPLHNPANILGVRACQKSIMRNTEFAVMVSTEQATVLYQRDLQNLQDLIITIQR